MEQLATYSIVLVDQTATRDKIQVSNADGQQLCFEISESDIKTCVYLNKAQLEKLVEFINLQIQNF